MLYDLRLVKQLLHHGTPPEAIPPLSVHVYLQEGMLHNKPTTRCSRHTQENRTSIPLIDTATYHTCACTEGVKVQLTDGPDLKTTMLWIKTLHQLNDAQQHLHRTQHGLLPQDRQTLRTQLKKDHHNLAALTNKHKQLPNPLTAHLNTTLTRIQQALTPESDKPPTSKQTTETQKHFGIEL